MSEMLLCGAPDLLFLRLSLQRNAMQTVLPFLFISRGPTIISPFYKQKLLSEWIWGEKSIQYYSQFF